MNFIKEINALFVRKEEVPLSGSAIALWLALMQMSNKLGWRNEFTVAGTVLRMKAGLKESTFKHARKELKEKGYIDYESRSHNQAPIYRLESLQIHFPWNGSNDQSVDHLDNQPVDQGDDHSVNQGVGTLIKQKQNQKKRNTTTTTNTLAAVVFYQENFGEISPFVAKSLANWVDDMGDSLVVEAMKRALEKNKNNWGYVKGILQAWAKKGLRTVDAVEADEVEFRNKQKWEGGSIGTRSKEIVPDWFRELKQKGKVTRPVDPVKAEEARVELEELKREIGVL